MSSARRAWLLARVALASPVVLLVRRSRARPDVEADVRRWTLIGLGQAIDGGSAWHLGRLFVQYPEFRTLLYYRVPAARLLGLPFPRMTHLYLVAESIGPGFYVQHGFATIVHAKTVGANCWVNQQVTVGFSGPGRNPVIGDDVTIRAGAKVIGAVHVGDKAVVGANAVVVKDVPANCTVVGVPARIVKRDGVRVA